jgi:DNA uptake protein ComE-like DNA-binding protein
LFLLLLPILVIGLIAPLRATLAAGPPPSIRSSVDPNTAPWYELTVLPRIGEEMARRIVRYRESVADGAPAGGDARVFGGAADLANVRGIGPVTLQRIGPYLHFKQE